MITNSIFFFFFVLIITHIRQVKEIFLFFPYGYLLSDDDTLIVLMIKILFYVRRKINQQKKRRPSWWIYLFISSIIKSFCKLFTPLSFSYLKRRRNKKEITNKWIDPCVHNLIGCLQAMAYDLNTMWHCQSVMHYF